MTDSDIATNPRFAVLAGAGISVAYIALARTLPDWWTQVDYCPGTETFCSGVPPLLLAFVPVMIVAAIAVRIASRSVA